MMDEAKTIAELDGNNDDSYITLDKVGGDLFFTAMAVQLSFKDSYERVKVMGVSLEDAMSAEQVFMCSYYVSKNDALRLAEELTKFANDAN
jgi:hypothetical protein